MSYRGTATNTCSGGTNITNGSLRATVSRIGTETITFGDTTGTPAAFLNPGSGTISNAITVQGNGTSTLSASGSGSAETFRSTITLNNTTAVILTNTVSSGTTPIFTCSGSIAGTGGLALTRNGTSLNNLTVNLNSANMAAGGACAVRVRAVNG